MTGEIDIAVEQDQFGKFDINFAENGDFVLTKGFDTAINMSIYCERRATAAEVPVASRRRGWWGNVASQIDNFEIGSKVWLIKQERKTAETLNRIKDYINLGLEWLIIQDHAVDVATEVTLINGSVRLIVSIKRPNGQVEKRGYELWQNT